MASNRTSIFEAFNMPSTSLPSPPQHKAPEKVSSVRYSAEEVLNHITSYDDDNDCDVDAMFNDVEEVENCGGDNGTLWMSCSPGRDSDAEEEDMMGNTVTYESLNLQDETDSKVMERHIPIETLKESESDEPKVEKVHIKNKFQVKNKDQSNKPLSSYALFFRDTQIAIKDQNPDISFGEISRVVCTMWANLDDNHKQYYNKLSEEARQQERRFKKLLHRERESQVNKDKLTSKKLMKEKRIHQEKSIENRVSKPMTKNIPQKTYAEEVRAPAISICLREGCSNRAIDDPRWNKEYCSTQCVVSHCKDVFKAWVAMRKSTTQEDTEI